LTEHLADLRKGAVRSLILVAIGLGVAFWQSSSLFAALLYPFKSALAKFPQVSGQVHTLQTLTPIEAFMINMKLALVGGIVLASPLVLREIWSFTAPALKPNERGAILFVFCLGLFFFAAGVLFGYFVVIPMALDFLIRYNLDYQFIPQWTLQGYFGFVIDFLVIFGVIFELPLVLMALVAIGVATPAFLTQKWKQAVFGIFVLSAIIAPSADPITMTIVAIPLIGLYVIGIGLSWLASRRRNAVP
jgi:sec-independent protein translocase protein TatC